MKLLSPQSECHFLKSRAIGDTRAWKSRLMLMILKDFGANCHARHGSVYTATYAVTTFSSTRKNSHENQIILKRPVKLHFKPDLTSLVNLLKNKEKGRDLCWAQIQSLSNDPSAIVPCSGRSLEGNKF